MLLLTTKQKLNNNAAAACATMLEISAVLIITSTKHATATPVYRLSRGFGSKKICGGTSLLTTAIRVHWFTVCTTAKDKRSTIKAAGCSPCINSLLLSVETCVWYSLLLPVSTLYFTLTSAAKMGVQFFTIKLTRSMIKKNRSIYVYNNTDEEDTAERPVSG